MSFSLKLTDDGDLDISSHSFGIVMGVEKLKQDLSGWLREEYGLDRFHPSYGSTLQNFIGEVIDDLTMHEIESEVQRVLSVYQQNQIIALQKNPGAYKMDELLDSVVSVNSKLNYDTVYVDIVFTTGSGTVAAITEGITL